MAISVRTRRDVVVVDPDRFLAAARHGLSPAGWLQQVVLDDPQPLQDYGCFLPQDPFRLPGATHGPR